MVTLASDALLPPGARPGRARPRSLEGVRVGEKPRDAAGGGDAGARTAAVRPRGGLGGLRRVQARLLRAVVQLFGRCCCLLALFTQP